MPQDKGYSSRLQAMAIGESFVDAGTAIHPAWSLARRWQNAAAALRHNRGLALRIAVRADRAANTCTVTRVADDPVDPQRRFRKAA